MSTMHGATSSWKAWRPPVRVMPSSTRASRRHDPLPSRRVRLASSAGETSPSFDDLVMPEIGEDLVDFQEEAGAVFGEGSASPLSYGNNSRALFSMEEDAAVIDASEWTRLRVVGPDAEAFLHGQLSVDVKRMAPGTGREACLLTPQGRVVDLLLLLRMEAGFMVICSPGMGSEVKNHLEKHIFMGDDVKVRSVSADRRLGEWGCSWRASCVKEALLQAVLVTHPYQLSISLPLAPYHSFSLRLYFSPFRPLTAPARRATTLRSWMSPAARR